MAFFCCIPPYERVSVFYGVCWVDFPRNQMIVCLVPFCFVVRLVVWCWWKVAFPSKSFKTVNELAHVRKQLLAEQLKVRKLEMTLAMKEHETDG